MAEETLDRLGKLIPQGVNPGRDAVHIAVLPAKASGGHQPGEHVAVDPRGFAHSWAERMPCTIGIVDPFLPRDVTLKEGDQFYVYLYPSSISGLRHVWTLPGLADEPLPPAFETQIPKTPSSTHWFKDDTGAGTPR